MKNAIHSQDVSFQYFHTNHAFLKNINFDIKPGECILICGSSGSGKSTLSRLINGISPDYIEGELTGHFSTSNLVAGEATIEEYMPVVGSVFQNPKTQHFTINTTSELAFPMENMGIAPNKILETIEEKARIFEVNHLLDRNMFEISGGEKQQIAFVAANMFEPEVLVLDEVTSNLDQEAIIRITKMVKYLKAKGVTIIILEHRLAWTRDVVDRYILLDDGELSQEWSAKEFIGLKNEELNNFGLRSMDLSVHRKVMKEKTVNIHELSKKGILQTNNLSIGYLNKTILKNLNLSFRQGEIIGILGPNGTGKSTLANTLTGLLAPLSGQILWNEQPIHSKELINKSYLVMQDMNYQLFTDSVKNEILLGAKHPEYLKDILTTLNLEMFIDRHPMSLSEGQKQRVAIASAILSGKEIIIFDEPTSGLDFDNMQRFGYLLDKLKETKAVILVITHDEELAAEFCDKIIDINKKMLS